MKKTKIHRVKSLITLILALVSILQCTLAVAPHAWAISMEQAELAYDPELAIRVEDEDSSAEESMETMRSLEELRSFDCVIQDESGRVVAVEDDPNNPLTYAEINMLLSGGTAIASQSAEVDTITPAYLQTPFSLSADKVEQGIRLHGDANAFHAAISGLWLIHSYTPFDGPVLDEILDLICSGYSCDQAIAARVASHLLGVSVPQLCQEKENEIESSYGQEEYKPYERISIFMGVPHNVVERFMETYEGTEDELHATMEAARVAAYPSPDEGQTQMMSVALLSDTSGAFYPEQVLEKPYTYDQIGALTVNVNTGSFSYAETDLSIPGVNGLDLNITRRFDFDYANTYNAYGQYRDEYATEKVAVCYDWYLMENNKPGTLISNRDNYIFYPAMTGTANFTAVFNARDYNSAVQFLYGNEPAWVNGTWHYMGGMLYAGAVDIQGKSVNIVLVPSLKPSSQNCTLALVNFDHPYKYLVEEYGIGHGWRLGFSAVETFIGMTEGYGDWTEKARLITADGKRYAIKDYSPTSGYLDDYELTDMEFGRTTPSEYPNATHKLVHQDGRTEYFNSAGRNIAIVDRFGNKITLAYTITNGAVSKIEIRDTMNNIVVYENQNIDLKEFVYPSLPDGRSYEYNVLWTLSLNGSVIRRYYILDACEYYNDTMPDVVRGMPRLLTAVENENNEFTTYGSGMQQHYAHSYFSSTTRVRKGGVTLTTSDVQLQYADPNPIAYPNGLVLNRIYDIEEYSLPRRFGLSGFHTDTPTQRVDYYYKVGKEQHYVYRRGYEIGDYSNIFRSHSLDEDVRDKYTAIITDYQVKNFGTKNIAWPTARQTLGFEPNHRTSNVRTDLYSPIQYESVEVTGVTPSTPYLYQTTAYYYKNEYFPLPRAVHRTYYNADGTASRNENYAYTYDSKGNMLTETRPNGQVVTRTYHPTYSLPLTMTYWQNQSTKIEQINQLTAKNDNIEKTEVKVTKGTTTEIMSKTVYAYDAKGRLENRKDYIDATRFYEQEFIYGSSALPTDVINVTAEKYDTDNNPTLGQKSPDGSYRYTVSKVGYNARGWPNSVTDAKGQKTSIQYDPVGRVTKVIHPDGSFEQYSYDVSQNTVLYTNARGTKLLYTYTAQGSLKSITDVASGQVMIRHTYDQANRLVASTIHRNYGEDTNAYYIYDGLGRVVETGTKNAAGAVTSKESYAYQDGSGKVTSTVHGDANAPSIVTTSYTDIMGNVTQTGRMFGGKEYTDTYQYDYLGNCTKAISAYTKALGGTDPTTATTMYNWAGQPLTVTNANGETISTKYDWLGNVTEVTDPKGTITNYEYDSFGRLKEVRQPMTDTQTSVTRYDYDLNGNVLAQKVGPNQSTVLNIQTYTYDNRNRLRTATAGTSFPVEYVYDGGTSNILFMITGKIGAAAGSTTGYTYDRFGNLETVTDPEGRVESYRYDLDGTLVEKTDRNQNTTVYQYDNLGRPLQSEVLSPAGARLELATQRYTLIGQRLNESYGGKTTTYTYDELGRLKTEKLDTTTKTYGDYNLADQPGTFKMTIGATTFANTSYQYDALARLRKVTDGAVTASYEYDANGNRKTLQYGNGITASYEYNKANQVTLVSNAKSGVTLSRYGYTYYEDGNQATKTDLSGKVTSYGYNQAGALESETERRNSTLLQSYTYQYDNLGNREKLTAAGGKSYTVDYAYDKSNRLQTETRTQGSAVHMTDYYYDPNGNMISTMLSQLTPVTAGDKAALDIGNNLDDVAFYGYDGFNRQTSVQSGDTQASYAYLPSGLRASKTVDGVTTSFVWSGSQMILERGAGGDVTYIRGINLIASRKGAESTYYLHNGHGDVTQLANASGAVTRSYDYDAFGVEQNPVGTDANPFRYCGEYWDGETETYYLRARNYSPATGRFTSEDPIRAGLNWYTYCSGNPVRFFDPSGLAEYRIGGLSLAPTFVHDPGYVYDPDEKATMADLASWMAWGTGILYARVAIGQDAANMYAHYRSGVGGRVEVDYARAYNEEPIIKAAIDNEVSIMRNFVNSSYANNGETSFEIIGDLQGIPNGEVENWHKTIGAHYVYGHGSVTIDPETGAATMVVTFYMEDVYNFNPGAKDIMSQTPDAVHGRFAVIGWAKEFTTYGSITQTVTWNVNDPNVEVTVVTGEGR